MNMEEFLRKYFINPMYTGEGYNLYNTIVYGILLGIGIILSYKIIKRLKINVDEKFLTSLIPFLLLGSTIRALADANILPRVFPFLTPGIFFTMFVIYVSLLIIVYKKMEYPKDLILIGIFMNIYPLYLLIINIKHFEAIYYCLKYFIPLSSLVLLFYKLGIDRFYLYVIIAHMFDLSSTLAGINHYGYFEVHYFENILINMLNFSYILIPIKIFILLIIYKVLNVLELNERNFWYTAVFILGFSPGFRDLFKIMLLG